MYLLLLGTPESFLDDHETLEASGEFPVHDLLGTLVPVNRVIKKYGVCGDVTDRLPRGCHRKTMIREKWTLLQAR